MHKGGDRIPPPAPRREEEGKKKRRHGGQPLPPFAEERSEVGMVATMMELVSGRTSATAHRLQHSTFLSLSPLKYPSNMVKCRAILDGGKILCRVCDSKWAMGEDFERGRLGETHVLSDRKACRRNECIVGESIS
ncbi:hypothetical protein CEXT_586461 [Caerostris extrusa]|uniref:Recombination activating protein 1 n=1 Tax=Caerostris extrusa TaxID=172846 RepID=A0AAV4RCZ7_CAEEX|nr:hypothetical protein CEXT_586461 [Caerostris extrusa]